MNRSFLSGGSATGAMDAGSTSTVSFVGTGIRLLGYCGEWSGMAEVYLDGEFAGTIDTYSFPAVNQGVIYQIASLASGSHTLTIKVLNQKNSASGGAWVWLDAFDVTP
jgi:hypothetical protein